MRVFESPPESPPLGEVVISGGDFTISPPLVILVVILFSAS